MRHLGKWLMALGLLAIAPATSDAALWGNSAQSQQAAKQKNQKAANEVAGALRNAKLQGYDIGIEVKEGTAILTGEVTDPAQKDKATQVASKAKGVKKVDNRLIVSPPKAVAARQAVNSQKEIQQTSNDAPPTNQQMAENIAGALGKAGLSGFDLEVRYEDGQALIGGAVAATLRWSLMSFDPPLAVLMPLQLLHALTYGATHLAAIHFIARAVPEAAAGTAQALYASVAAGVIMGAATLASGPLFAAYGGGAYWAPAALSTVGLAAAEIGAATQAALAALRPLGISCMPQAAVLRSLLCSAGFDAQIRFGVHRTADGLEAHAWVEVDGEPVNEPSDIAQRFPVLATASELSGAVLV